MESRNEKRKTGRMYLACGLILMAGMIGFAFLMAAAYEVVHGFEEAQAYAVRIYLYFGGSAVPCALAVGMLAAVIHEIGEGRAFSVRNEKWMRGIGAMAFLEGVYILTGLVGWSAVGIMHPGVMLIALALMLAASGVGLLAWALAGLIHKAGVLQQENDLTV